MKAKLRAGGIHLLASFLLVSCVLAFLMLVCYTDPYYKVLGIGKIMVLIAGVDIGLGPLITFVIFDPREKRMKLQLAVVAALQLSALAYGAATLFIGRPAYIAFHQGQFAMVQAFEISDALLAKLGNVRVPVTGPALVGLRVGEDKAARRQSIDAMAEYHVDLARLPQYYVPYASVTDEVKAIMRTLDELKASVAPAGAAAASEVLDKAVARSGLAADALAAVALHERDNYLTVLLRRSDASIVTVLPINPCTRGGAIHCGV